MIGFVVICLATFSFILFRKKFFTIRSSKLWKDITTNLPFGPRAKKPFSSPISRLVSSSFTAIRRAWKVLVAGGSLPLRFPTTWTRSNVVAKGLIFLLSTISRAIFLELFSSPKPRKMSSIACSSQEFKISAAVIPVLDILISNGSSFRKENPLFDFLSWSVEGHSQEVRRRFPTVEVVAIDQDPDVDAIRANFRDLDKVVTRKVDAVLFDLGPSTDQLKKSNRGF